MNKGDDQRAQELTIIKIELATFALRLDAFEARMRGQLTKTSAEPSKLGSSDIGPAKQVTEPMKHHVV
jgi:hypothetical protein